MVEGEHLIEEEQAGIGDFLLVCRFFGHTFDQADGIVGEEADCAGGEGRKVLEASGLVAAEGVTKDGEDVAFHIGGALAFRNGDLVAAGDDTLVGREADEGIAAYLVAAFDGFEQEALGLLPGGAQEGGDGGF